MQIPRSAIAGLTQRHKGSKEEKEDVSFTSAPLTVWRIGGKVRGDGAFPFVTIV